MAAPDVIAAAIVRTTVLSALVETVVRFTAIAQKGDHDHGLRGELLMRAERSAPVHIFWLHAISKTVSCYNCLHCDDVTRAARL